MMAFALVIYSVSFLLVGFAKLKEDYFVLRSPLLCGKIEAKTARPAMAVEAAKE